MGHLSITLLGQMQATRDGEPVTRFRGDTARALLAYLVVQPGTAFPRAQLAALLWPDHPESEALQNLRQALRRLRTAIGDGEAEPPFLLATRETLALNPEGDYACDVIAFGEAVAASKAHRHRRLAECPACVERLGGTAALYGGEFLAGFSLDSALYEEWMVVEREHLHGQALEVLETLAAYHEGREAYEQALQYARRQIEMEPWREGAHRQAMRALALSGDRAGALAQYEVCCRALEEELGVEPEAETRALYERIREGAELQSVSPAAPHNLPASPTPFIGREDALAEIEARLDNPDCRLLTLVGPGGIGKTRLALEVGRRQLGRHEDGVFFCPLAPLGSAEAIVPTVAQAIGLAFYGQGDLEQQLLNALRRKRMLLILDSYEHLLTSPVSLPAGGAAERGGADLVSEVLKRAPDVQLLVTSRERLNVQGEHVYAVEGMAVPDQTSQVCQTGDVLERYSAVRLFLESARRVSPDFGASGEALAEVAQICRLVAGMPLAIVLAASWVDVLSPAEIAAEIAGDLGFLETELRDVPVRHRSVRACFDRSWTLLSEGERKALAAFSVFRGRFTREAARSVAGADLRVLSALARKSLLHRGSNGRYELHELLRQYAEEKLEQSPEARDAVRDRHCAYYAAALEAWNTDLQGARRQAALAEMDLEIENARAAWDWAAAHIPQQVEILARSMDVLSDFYYLRGRYQEAEVVLQDLAARLQDGASAAELLLRARALAGQAELGLYRRSPEFARRLVQQSLDCVDEAEAAGQDIRRARASVLQIKCGILLITGEHDQARRVLQECLALFRATGDRLGEAWATWQLGWLANWSCLYGEGERLFEESLRIYRTLDNAAGIATSLSALGWVSGRLGRLERGERLLREAIALFQEAEIRHGEAHVHYFLGRLFSLAGRYRDARALCEKAQAIYVDYESRPRGGEALEGMAEAERHLGEYSAACAHLQQSLKLAQRAGSLQKVALDLCELGAVELAEGAHAEAMPLLEESLDVARKARYRDIEMRALVNVGCAVCRLGDYNRARQYICAALRIADEARAMAVLVPVIPLVALFLADRGEAARAVELYALACRYPHVANSRWFEDMVGVHIAAAAETLPPDVVAAAQERGRARDLEATVSELLAELEE